MGQAAAANETFKRPLALSSERTRATILTAMRIAAHAIAIGKKADAADSHLGYV
jgi:hypothetical protein